MGCVIKSIQQKTIDITELDKAELAITALNQISLIKTQFRQRPLWNT